MRFLASLVVALVCSSGTALATDPTLVGLAEPSANMIMSLNFAAMRNWPGAANAFQQGGNSNPQWAELVQTLGVDPFELVDEFLMAATVDNLSSNAKFNDATVLFKGRFDVAHLTGLICRQGCTPQPVGAFTFLPLPRNDSDARPPGGIVFFDSSYGAIGSLEDVRRTARRFPIAASPQLNPAMAGWVDNLSNYDLWIAASGPFNRLPADEAGAMDPMAAGAISKIAAFGVGIGVSNNVDIALQVLSNNEGDANQLREMAQGLIALATLNADPQQPGLSEFIKRIQLSQKGNLVLASMSVPQEDLDQAMQQAGGVPGGGAVAAMGGEASSPEPARDGGIIIVGGEQPPERVRLKRSNR